jgi:protease I
MADKNLGGMRVAILVTNDFEQDELIKPRAALEEAGANTSVIAPKAAHVQAMKHDEKTVKIDVDLTLDKANPDEFDAVLLPGGALNADQLRVEPKAQEFIKAMDQARKPIAVICHAPWLLVSAGLVRNRSLTSYHTIRDDIRNAGGRWQDNEVVRDANWVSSRQPSDIPAFNKEMLALFSERKARGKSA